VYNWNAKDYHKSSTDQQKWVRELILKIALKDNKRVSDIGCGDGKQIYWKISSRQYRTDPCSIDEIRCWSKKM